MSILFAVIENKTVVMVDELKAASTFAKDEAVKGNKPMLRRATAEEMAGKRTVKPAAVTFENCCGDLDVLQPCDYLPDNVKAEMIEAAIDRQLAAIPEIYDIWTDGSSDNPGKSGWAWIQIVGDKIVAKHTGHIESSTNNAMELQAISDALAFAKPDTNVIIHTDSQLCIGWLSKNFKCKANPECIRLVAEIKARIAEAKLLVVYEKAQGHSADRWNKMADEMANQARFEGWF